MLRIDQTLLYVTVTIGYCIVLLNQNVTRLTININTCSFMEKSIPGFNHSVKIHPNSFIFSKDSGM